MEATSEGVRAQKGLWRHRWKWPADDDSSPNGRFSFVLKRPLSRIITSCGKQHSLVDSVTLQIDDLSVHLGLCQNFSSYLG